MAVRFVATEILSSADGLSHGETQVLETDEVRAARAAGGGGGKTLYEQLEAEREKQQEAYDANTKALFSPGEVLDAEDVAFYEAEQRRAAAARAARAEDEASEFAAARAAAAPAAPPPVVRAAPAPARAADPPPAVRIRRRPAAAGAGAEAATRRGRGPRGPRRVLVLLGRRRRRLVTYLW
jgi:hypothetical protein